jgi:hypothetical protein
VLWGVRPGTVADGEAWPAVTATRDITWRYPPSPPAESLRLYGSYGRMEWHGMQEDSGDAEDEWELGMGWTEDEAAEAEGWERGAPSGAGRAAPALLPWLFD